MVALVARFGPRPLMTAGATQENGRYRAGCAGLSDKSDGVIVKRQTARVLLVDEMSRVLLLSGINRTKPDSGFSSSEPVTSNHWQLRLLKLRRRLCAAFAGGPSMSFALRPKACTPRPLSKSWTLTSAEQDAS
jgi:hypothetical protein